MSAFVAGDQKRPRTDPERALREAADLVDCHPETLRRRIRAGQLAARRGPHGAYLVRESALAMVWVQPMAGRRPRTDDAGSWSALAKLIYQYDKTHKVALELLDEVRREPSARPRLTRLVEVQRLRLRGLTYGRIAETLEISERQARRLSGRDLEVALRIELVRDAKRAEATARRRARDVVATIEEQLRAQGYAGRARSEIVAAWPRNLGKLQRGLTKGERGRLRSVGVTHEQVEAIQVAGIPADALSYLLSYGLVEHDPTGHESHQKGGAS